MRTPGERRPGPDLRRTGSARPPSDRAVARFVEAMDDELHGLDDQIHDDLVLATLLAEDGHPDAARRMLDRPRVRLHAARARVETVVANAAVERAAEEAVAGPVPEAEADDQGRAVPVRAVMAALVWLAAALLAVDAPSLEVLGSGTDPSNGVYERSSVQSADLAPSDRWAEHPATADHAASTPTPRRPWAPERPGTDAASPTSHETDADGQPSGTGAILLGLGGELGDLSSAGEQLGDLVEVPRSIVDRAVDDAGSEGTADGDAPAEHEEPGGSEEPQEPEEAQEPEDPDGSDDDDDEDGSGLLQPDDTDDADGDGSTGSLP